MSVGLPLLFVSVIGAQQAQAPVFRVNVQAVQVDVYVGRDGKSLVGLEKTDFQVFDNGVPQVVEHVDVGTTPLSIAMVLDTSDSVAGPKLLQLQEAGHAFLNGLKDGDRASLITFTHRIQRQTELIGKLDVVHDAIDHVESRGATAWRDALFAGVKTVETVPTGAVVLIFTDGVDTYSWLREEQLKPLVERSNAVVYAVYGSGDARTMPAGPTASSSWRRAWRESRLRHSRGTKILEEITEMSGGRFIETAGRGLKDVFLEILAEMKTRYFLTYQPSGVVQEGWHDVEVKLKGQKADVRARRGYFYEPDTP